MARRDATRTENCIVFATTSHARFEHARVLNNKTRAIPGITVRRYRSRSIPRQLNHCITGIIHTFTASIPGMVRSSLVSKYQNPVLHAFYYSKHAHAQTAHGRLLQRQCNFLYSLLYRLPTYCRSKCCITRFPRGSVCEV